MAAYYEILVITEDTETLKCFREGRQSSEYQITIGDDITEIFLLLQKEWDLLLLGEDVFQKADHAICRHIRERHSKDELPLIVLSTDTLGGEMDDWEFWCNDRMLPPYSRKEIEARMQKQLLQVGAIRSMSSLNRIIGSAALYEKGKHCLEVLLAEFQMIRLARHMIALEFQTPVPMGTSTVFQGMISKSFRGLEPSFKNNQKVLSFPYIEKNSMLQSFQSEPIQGHLLFLRLLPQAYALGLYRSSDEPPFSTLEIAYLQNIVDHIHGHLNQVENLKGWFTQSLKSLYEHDQQPLDEKTLYIRSEKPYAIAVSDSGEERTFKVSLNFLESFYSNTLLRISKSHLVMREKVVKLQRENHKVQRGKNRPCQVILGSLRDPVALPVGRTYISSLKEHVQQTI